MKFTKQEIKVSTTPNQPPDTPVQALVLGGLAVHGGLNANGTQHNYYYVITHIHSGYKLAEGYKQRNCKRLVEELHNLGIDWNFDAHFSTDEFREKALPILKEFNSNTNN